MTAQGQGQALDHATVAQEELVELETVVALVKAFAADGTVAVAVIDTAGVEVAAVVASLEPKGVPYQVQNGWTIVAGESNSDSDLAHVPEQIH